MWTKRKAISEAQNAIQQYQAQQISLESERQEVQKNIAEFRSQSIEQGQLLASSIIGKSVDEAHFQQVSDEWDLPSLIEKYRNLIDQRDRNVSERDSLLSHETIVNRSTLVESDDAVLTVAYHDAQSKFVNLTNELKAFEHPSFQWLYSRNLHSKEEPTGFKRLWKIVTLESKRKRSHVEKLKKDLKRTFYDLVKDHAKVTEELAAATRTRDEALGSLNEARNLISKFEELNQWDLQFESIVVRDLSRVLYERLALLPVSELMVRAPKHLRVYAAAVHALSKKIEYAEQLELYLRKEITDRKDRVSSISKVHHKWRRNPSGYVRGDKSKWLQSIPEMKRVGTNKRVGWSRSMRGNLRSFSSYQSYGHSYYHSHDHGGLFLAYDIFNHSPEIRMPYEGFSSQVIPEVSELREELPEDWVDEVIEGEEELPEELEENGETEDEIEESEEAAAAALAEDSENADEGQDDDVS